MDGVNCAVAIQRKGGDKVCKNFSFQHGEAIFVDFTLWQFPLPKYLKIAIAP